MSLSERQEMQAMAIEADREVGLQRREQDEVEFLKAALYIAFVPGASEFFDYLKTGLDSVLVNSRTTMAQASDVAQKSKSSGVSSPLSEGSKPAIPFRKPAESKVNVKTKIDFYAQQKGQQKKSRINFKGEKVA